MWASSFAAGYHFVDTFDGTFVGKVQCCKFGASTSLNLDLLVLGSCNLPFTASTSCQIQPSLDLQPLLVFDVSQLCIHSPSMQQPFRHTLVGHSVCRIYSLKYSPPDRTFCFTRLQCIGTIHSKWGSADILFYSSVLLP